MENELVHRAAVADEPDDGVRVADLDRVGGILALDGEALLADVEHGRVLDGVDRLGRRLDADLSDLHSGEARDIEVLNRESGERNAEHDDGPFKATGAVPRWVWH